MSRPKAIRIGTSRYYRRWVSSTPGMESLGFWNQTTESTHATITRREGETPVEFLKRFFESVRNFLINDLGLEPVKDIPQEDFVAAVEAGYNEALAVLAEEFGLEI